MNTNNYENGIEIFTRRTRKWKESVTENTIYQILIKKERVKRAMIIMQDSSVDKALRSYPRQSHPSCWINWGGHPKEIEFNLSRERITDNH